MNVSWGNIPASSTLPFFFHTFNSTGASVTISGFAIGDVLIYKGTSMTQRASTNGIVLIDTDGIDLDGTTGIQGFSIDLSDNSDAGFFAVGSFYTVVVGPITVNGNTVNFIAGTFRIVAAENAAGTPAAGLTTSERNSVADAILDRDMGAGTDSGSPTVRTVRQALRILRNKWSILFGTLTVLKEDDSTTSWTSTLSTDAAAVPIVGSDPAGP